MKCLEKVKKALLTVTDNVYHYEALNKTDQYIVWAEDSGHNQLNGNNSMLIQAVQGTIDLYTKTEGDSTVERIQDSLKRAGISFYLNSVQYEDESKYIHFEWIFEVS